MQIDEQEELEVSETSFTIKNSPRVVFVELYHSALSLVLFSVMAVGVLSTSNGWFKRLFLIFSIAYVLRIIYSPLSEWIFVKLEVSDFGVVYTSGILFRKARKMAWNDIAMLDRGSDPIREKLGGMKLSIIPVATKEDSCSLSFVATKDIDKLYQVSERFRGLDNPHHKDKDTPSRSPAREGRVLFSSPSKIEVLMLAIGYGEIFLAVPFVVGIAENLPQIGFNFTWEGASFWELVPQIGLVILIVAVFGIVATYLVYGRWHVTSYGESLEIETGVFTQKTASIPLHKSVFTTVKEPLGLKVLKKAQIRSITPASGQATTKNVIVPILGRAEVPGMLSMLGTPTKLPHQKIQWLPLRVLFFAIGALLVLLLWFVLKEFFPEAPSILVAAVFLLLIPITKMATTRLSFLTDNHGRPTYVVAAYGTINRTTKIADLEEINSMAVWQLRLSKTHHLIFWRFRYIANGARAIGGFQVTTQNDEVLRNRNDVSDASAELHHPFSVDVPYA